MVRCRLRPARIVLNGITSRKVRRHHRPCPVVRPAFRLVGDGKILNTIDGAGPTKRRPRARLRDSRAIIGGGSGNTPAGPPAPALRPDPSGPPENNHRRVDAK